MDLGLVHLDMLAKSSSSGELKLLLKPKFGINLHKIHSSGQPFLLPNFGKAVCAAKFGNKFGIAKLATSAMTLSLR